MTEVKQAETKSGFKAFVNEHKTEIIIVTGAVSAAIWGYLGYKYIPKLTNSSSKALPPVATPKLTTAVDTIIDAVEPVVEKKVPRYLVEFKAFKTGDWHTKTRTDYINSAYSVASCNRFGRACRIIDTTTGFVLKEILEDASMASCNGYPNGYPW